MSEYLERLAADGVLAEIDRLYDSVERGEYVPVEPMTPTELENHAR